MKSSAQPTRVPLPFAANGSRNAIPTDSQVSIKPGAASLSDGFPPLTRLPIAAGGVPPFQEDFNGIFYLLSSNILWANAGGAASYDAGFSTSIGGYPKGAVLRDPLSLRSWISTVDGNTTDPASNSSSGWLVRYGGGTPTVTVFSTPGSFSWTVPPGVYWIRAGVIGGGGGGGECITNPNSVSGSVSGAGGGAGGFARGIYAVTPGQVLTIVVGAGGASQGSGGTSSCGNLCSAAGGAYGLFIAQGPSSPGGAGGPAYGGTLLNMMGGYGSDGQSGNLYFAGNGAPGPYGGGGRAGANGGQNATGPGAGGGGAYDSTGSGTRYYGGIGGAGLVMLEYVT